MMGMPGQFVILETESAVGYLMINPLSESMSIEALQADHHQRWYKFTAGAMTGNVAMGAEHMGF